MSCTAPERMNDPQHIATCRACRARALLDQFEPELPSRMESSRMWAKIERGRAPAPWFGFNFALASIAVTAVVAIGILSFWPETLPSEEWVTVPSGTPVPMAGAAIELESAGQLWIEPAEVGRELRVFKGVLSVDEQLAETPVLAIETPRARIMSIGAKYRVEVEPRRTKIEVQRGSVEVVVDGAKRVLRAGESIEISDAVTRKDLATARALIGKDDQRASEIADRVLAEKPRAEDEVEALIVAADARRRSGRLQEAELRYGRVIDHPAGKDFAEEAALRRASLLAELGRTDEAVRVLESAQERFASGVLSPERVALLAHLHFVRGELIAAADLIEGSGNDWVLDPVRLAVAGALLKTDPSRVARVLGTLPQRSPQARQMIERARSK